jgi:predicted membrane protein
MILTDHEWLRFVTFGLFAGAVLGALYAGALLTTGRGLTGALVGAVLGGGILALVVHLTLRWLLGRASEPAAGDEGDGQEVAEA